MVSVFFSIIVPVYNVNDSLPRCIESIISQSFKDFELILVDDGSKDGSDIICDRYSIEDHRIKVIHKENGGVSSARNDGLQLATGKYIVFVDSDDYVDEGFLFDMYSVGNEGDLGCIGYMLEDNEKNVSKQTKFVNETIEIRNLNAINNLFVDGRFNYIWGKVFDKSIIVRNQLCFDECISIGEDILFVLQYLQNINNINFLDSVAYHYVKNGTKTLSSDFTSFQSLKQISYAHEHAYVLLKEMLGNACDKSFFIWAGELYRDMIYNLIHQNRVDKEYIRFLFRVKSFRKSLNYVNVLYAKDSNKFKFILRTKSYLVFMFYLLLLNKKQ